MQLLQTAREACQAMQAAKASAAGAAMLVDENSLPSAPARGRFAATDDVASLLQSGTGKTTSAEKGITSTQPSRQELHDLQLGNGPAYGFIPRSGPRTPPVQRRMRALQQQEWAASTFMAAPPHKCALLAYGIKEA